MQMYHAALCYFIIYYNNCYNNNCQSPKQSTVYVTKVYKLVK
jgi:hypothetical protein